MNRKKKRIFQKSEYCIEETKQTKHKNHPTDKTSVCCDVI